MKQPDYPCPCCGYMVFDERPGSYAVCPICYWEDDAVQLLNPSFVGGANKANLVESQVNFERYGAMEERFAQHVRAPGPEDRRAPTWRRLVASDLEKPLCPADLRDEEWKPEILYYWLRNAC